MRNNLDAIKNLAIDLYKLIFLELFCFICGISSLLHFWYQFFASFLVSVLCFIFGFSSLLHLWYQFFTSFLLYLLCFFFLIDLPNLLVLIDLKGDMISFPLEIRRQLLLLQKLDEE